MNEYRGWEWYHTAHKSGANWGGTEKWVEVTFRHPDGRYAFATGPTLEEAFSNVRNRIDNKEDPQPDVVVSSSEIPF